MHIHGDCNLYDSYCTVNSKAFYCSCMVSPNLVIDMAKGGVWLLLQYDDIVHIDRFYML
jgi:hypothetical protein